MFGTSSVIPGPIRYSAAVGQIDPVLFRHGAGVLDRRGLLRVGAAALVMPVLSSATRAPSRPLDFLVVGDWGRNGHAYQQHVATQMGRYAKLANSRLTVSTGDNFYNFGVSSTTDPQWITSFEEIYTDPSLLNVPWFAVLGNHDYGGDVGAQVRRTTLSSRWQMPNRWFDIIPTERSDVHFFFLDTIAWRGHESLPFSVMGSGTSPDDAARQEQWLEAALKGSEAEYKIAFGHFPIYSVGPHGGHGPLDRMQTLDSILRKHGVTAYVCGHDHCLYYVKYEGMHYICSGGGSQELHRFTGDKNTSGCVLTGNCATGSPFWYYYIDRAGFAAFNVGDRGVSFSFIDRAGLMTPFTELPVPSAAISLREPRSLRDSLVGQARG